MSMNVRILCVDDEPNVLAGLERSLGFDFEVETADSGAQGLALLASRPPFAVVVSDMRMPEMDGVAFLARVRETSPRTVRVLLTGHSDMSAAIAAVNEGQIFRFLTKPCPAPLLRNNLRAACEQHRLLLGERDLLEGTLRGSVRALTDVLSLVHPQAFSRAERVAQLVRDITTASPHADQLWELEVAALLSQLGSVAVPSDILAKVSMEKPLTPAEEQIYLRHPILARQLLSNVPRLEGVAAMIEAAYEPSSLEHRQLDSGEKERLRWGAQVLRLALELDRLVMRTGSLARALKRLPDRMLRFDAKVAETLIELTEHSPAMTHLSVSAAQLELGMTLDQDVRSKKGLLLVARGQQVGPTLLQKLQAVSRRDDLQEPIRVALAELA